MAPFQRLCIFRLQVFNVIDCFHARHESPDPSEESMLLKAMDICRVRRCKAVANHILSRQESLVSQIACGMTQRDDRGGRAFSIVGTGDERRREQSGFGDIKPKVSALKAPRGGFADGMFFRLKPLLTNQSLVAA